MLIKENHLILKVREVLRKKLDVCFVAVPLFLPPEAVRDFFWFENQATRTKRWARPPPPPNLVKVTLNVICQFVNIITDETHNMYKAIILLNGTFTV